MLLLTVLATVTYLPALQAGWIWDDDSYILDNPAVQLPEGIVHAWVPGATPQYYPLVFVSFWVQHAVHGLEPFGYHLVNLLLHLASSVLLWRLLVALRLPGALFAAALFAVHPVQVETVAWVTERKNVLSMAFSLASLLAWVRFLQDARPFSARAGWWGASFVLFCTRHALKDHRGGGASDDGRDRVVAAVDGRNVDTCVREIRPRCIYPHEIPAHTLHAHPCTGNQLRAINTRLSSPVLRSGHRTRPVHRVG
jgi:hypothetical protein